MTTTSDRTVEPRTGRGAAERGQARPAGRVPAPPRPRRRWGVFAAMLALVAVGAVGNVWLHAATTDARSVVVARVTIERGSVIDRSELSTVEVGAGCGAERGAGLGAGVAGGPAGRARCGGGLAADPGSR